MNEELLINTVKQRKQNKQFWGKVSQTYLVKLSHILNLGTILYVYALYISLVIHQKPALSFLSLAISATIYFFLGSSRYCLYSPSLAAIWIMKQQKNQFDYYYIASTTLLSGIIILAFNQYQDSLRAYANNFPKKLIISSLWSFTIYFCLEQIDFAFGDLQQVTQFDYPDALEKFKFAMKNSVVNVEYQKYLIYTCVCTGFIIYCMMKNFLIPIIFLAMCFGIILQYLVSDQFKPFYNLTQQQTDIHSNYQLELNISQFLKKLDIETIKMSLILSISLIAESTGAIFITKKLFKGTYNIKKELLTLGIQNIISSLVIGLPVSINIIASVIHAKLQSQQINSSSKSNQQECIQNGNKNINEKKKIQKYSYLGLFSGCILQLMFLSIYQIVMSIPIFIICSIQYSAVITLMLSIIKRINQLSYNMDKHRCQTIAIILLGIFWNPIISSFIGLIYYILTELDAIKGQIIIQKLNRESQDNPQIKKSSDIEMAEISSKSINNNIERLNQNRETLILNNTHSQQFPYLTRHKSLQIDFTKKLSQKQLDFQSEFIEEKIMFRNDYENIILNFFEVEEIEEDAWSSLTSLIKDCKKYSNQILFLEVNDEILEQMFDQKEIRECMKARKATLNWRENQQEDFNELNILYIGDSVEN